MDDHSRLQGDLLAWLFTEDVLLPSQVEAPPRPFTPERRLLFALLADAISMIARAPTSRESRKWRGDAREVWDWIDAVPVPGDRFAFPAVCEEFDLDPEAVRRALRRGCPTRVSHGKRGLQGVAA